MRVLVVSHTYVAAVNQQKLAAIADLGVELGLVVPRLWRDGLRPVPLDVPRPDDCGRPPFAVYASDIYGNGSVRRYFYPPLALRRAVAAFGPDLVHVEEEPDSAACFETLLLSRSRPLTFFTWENIYRRSAGWPAEALVLRRARGAIAGSAEAAAVLRRKGFRRPVVVAPQLGIDPQQFRRRDASVLRQRLGLEPPVVGYVGRLVPEKGVATLLDAVAGSTAPLSLLLLGDGPLRAELVARGRTLPGRFVWAPSVPHDDVVDYLNCLDVLVLPSRTTSRWKEQFGHVLIEAMACEVPVVGADSGAIPEVIGDAGLVFAEGDAAQLRAHLERLADDDGLRRRLAEAGRQRVLQLYTHQRVAEQTVALWREVLGR